MNRAGNVWKDQLTVFVTPPTDDKGDIIAHSSWAEFGLVKSKYQYRTKQKLENKE